MKFESISLLSVLLAGPLSAQQPPASPSLSQAETQKTISSRLGFHVFPANGQNREQQQTDELACYNWAKQDAAFDPLEALTAPQQAKNTAPTPTSGTAAAAPAGAGVKGAAAGAGIGAAIGAIAGDPGKSAAIGAASGGIRGRMAPKRAQAEAHQRAQQQAQRQSQAKAKTEASLDDFKKAYSACMDAKGYSLR